jgi:hypothetical protein
VDGTIQPSYPTLGKVYGGGCVMAVRTTYAEVAKIIEVDTTITTDLVPFIEAANALVTEVCTDSGYTTERLELIERWLSAHFYAIRDPRPETEKAGSVSVKYQSKVELGFDVTHYGQMAMRLATAGELAALNNQAKNGGKQTVGVSWLGESDADFEDK